MLFNFEGLMDRVNLTIYLFIKYHEPSHYAVAAPLEFASDAIHWQQLLWRC